MAKDIALIDPSTIPAYVINHERAKSLNSEALQGLTFGGQSSIRIRNGKFRLKESGSEDVVIKPAELAEQGTYLPVIILSVRGPISKAYYAKPYDPNQDEPSVPDCFSFDGKTPDSTVKNPICANCATCPMNAFNSGRNAAGQPTKGKACTDTKILAVAYKGGIYSMKVPPASLKNLATYLRELERNGVPYPHVLTYIGFDDESEYSILTFRVGFFARAEKIAAIEEMVNSREVYDIMNPVAFVPAAEAPKQVAADPPAKEAVQKAPVTPIKPKAKPADEPVETVAAPAAAKAPTQEEMDTLMGL